MRYLMLLAVHTQETVDPDRISFTLAVQELAGALVVASQIPMHQVPRVQAGIAACLTLTASLVQPRRLRFNCRVVKHICTRFRRKLPKHRNVTFHHLTFSDLLRI
ncbi:MAG: hypothetical protein NVS2B12_16690 [Ktedonobacteraceae bacterium]